MYNGRARLWGYLAVRTSGGIIMKMMALSWNSIKLSSTGSSKPVVNTELSQITSN